MANRTKGEIAFDVDGKPHTLVFDFNALCEAEEAFGVQADQIGTVIGGKAKNIRTLFRLGLSRHHPDTDDRAAGDIIGAIGLPRAAELIQQAFTASFPTEEASGKSHPRNGAKAG